MRTILAHLDDRCKFQTGSGRKDAMYIDLIPIRSLRSPVTTCQVVKSAADGSRLGTPDRIRASERIRMKGTCMKRILLPIILLVFAASSVLAADAPPGPDP